MELYFILDFALFYNFDEKSAIFDIIIIPNGEVAAWTHSKILYINALLFEHWSISSNTISFVFGELSEF